MNASSPPQEEETAGSPDGLALSRMVRTEQMLAVRRSVLAAIPVNLVLSLTVALLAHHSELTALGLAWLALSLAVNVTRIFVCRRPFVPAPNADGTDPSVDHELRLAWLFALLSGSVWALIPILCEGYTSPETLFYLTVVCGICAGSVTYGIAYAPVPVSFITPALLSVMGCLVWAGGFDRLMLAAMVLVYLAALMRAALQSPRGFREGSRLKNEAVSMAARLRQSHALSLESTRQLAFRVAHDALTGLLNREGFTQASSLRIDAGGKEREHGLLILGIDGFKAVNDAFGHKMGDRVLQDVAQWLQRELAGRDAILGRWGGDEFAALFVAEDGGPSPEQVAQALIESIASATAQYGGKLSASVGLCVERGVPIADMLSSADEALHEAKRAGRSRCRRFDEALRERLVTRRDVERDLPAAVASRAIGVWYQPILADGGRRLHSLEALLRWQHPRHGWIPPEDVIRAAASTGLAESLLRHILAEICVGLQELAAADPRFEAVPVAMNVSPREMSQLALDRIVLGEIARHGIGPHRIQIEITEEIALDTFAASARLHALADAGVAIVVDDFGVGYSSLASLRSKYVRQVKIDRSFIFGLAASPGNRVLVESVIRLGHSLRIDVVAEGVETVEELEALNALGCPLMQGYQLARPGPLDVIVPWARRLPG